MTKDEIYRKLESIDYIYGTMYGGRYYEDKVIKINKKSLHINSDNLVFIWGFPGPDYNIYRFKDYGKTWAFNETDFGNHK